MIVHDFHIDPSLPVLPEVRYTLEQFAINRKVNASFSSTGFFISDSEKAPVRISKKFIQNYTTRTFGHEENLGAEGFIEHEDGSRDYVSTAFYMLACLQEYNPASARDSIGRFRYSESYQAKFKNAGHNIVQQCFDKLAEHLGIRSTPVPTRFFLSHDIDTVYESILQDGFYALKRGRIDIIFNLLVNVAMSRPDWLNIDRIMKIESAYDVRSTFFWIVNKGKAGALKNADYDFNSTRIQKLVQRVEKEGFENGIHKSISPDSFQAELDQFEQKPIANRFHYLKFNLPSGFDALEASGLKIDASLGFAENIGFRNSYGLPYHPFNLKTRKAYSFVEVPLHVMDTTLFKYNKANLSETKNTLFNFFEANRSNCVLSVLWHNNFFTEYKYKGYLDLYKSILSYLKDNNLRTISQQEIIDQHSQR